MNPAPAPVQVTVGSDGLMRIPLVDNRTLNAPTAQISPPAQTWPWRATAQLPTLEQIRSVVSAKGDALARVQFIPRMLLLSPALHLRGTVVRINSVSSSGGEGGLAESNLRRWKMLPQSFGLVASTLDSPSLSPGGWLSVLGSARSRGRHIPMAETYVHLHLSLLVEIWSPAPRAIQVVVSSGDPLPPAMLPPDRPSAPERLPWRR